MTLLLFFGTCFRFELSELVSAMQPIHNARHAFAVLLHFLFNHCFDFFDSFFGLLIVFDDGRSLLLLLRLCVFIMLTTVIRFFLGCFCHETILFFIFDHLRTRLCIFIAIFLINCCVQTLTFLGFQMCPLLLELQLKFFINFFLQPYVALRACISFEFFVQFGL